MEKKEFSELLKNGMKKLEIEITEKQIEQFYLYMKLLLEWNEKINLTAIVEPKEVIQKHFIDSATIIKHLTKAKKIIDIGTGAGFPGIPVKIIKPEIEVVLLDSLNKRIMFLEELILKLELKNIKSIHSRAEEAGKNKDYREKFDVVVSRAVANMSTLSEYTIPFIKIGGKGIYLKGSEIDEELEQSKKAINVLGGKIEKIENFTLPDSDIKRNNVIIRKTRTTGGKYPRKPGIAKKEPIK